jgi:hypothetical protein
VPEVVDLVTDGDMEEAQQLEQAEEEEPEAVTSSGSHGAAEAQGCSSADANNQDCMGHQTTG